eukprot:7030807-Pyramimonas_sp.AAC.1
MCIRDSPAAPLSEVQSATQRTEADRVQVRSPPRSSIGLWCLRGPVGDIREVEIASETGQALISGTLEHLLGAKDVTP